MLTSRKDSAGTGGKLWKELNKRINKQRDKKTQAKNVLGGGDLESKYTNLVSKYNDSDKHDSNSAEIVEIWTRMVETGDRVSKGDYDKIAGRAYFAVTCANAPRKALVGGITNLDWAGKQMDTEGGATVHVTSNFERYNKTGNDVVVYASKSVVNLVEVSIDARDNFFEGTVSSLRFLHKTKTWVSCN